MTPLEFMAPGVCYALTMLAIWHFKGKRVHKKYEYETKDI